MAEKDTAVRAVRIDDYGKKVYKTELVLGYAYYGFVPPNLQKWKDKRKVTTSGYETYLSTRLQVEHKLTPVPRKC